MKIFFPPEPRSFPGRRAVKILLRAFHVLCAGLLSGAHLFGAGGETRASWLLATLVTGSLILLLDLHESGVFLLQVRGLVTAGKIGLLAALPAFDERQVWVLGALVVVSALISHAPARVRYQVVFGKRRFKGAETRG